MVTVQVVPDDVSHPVHMERTEPASGVAISVTVVPPEYEAEHADPQLIPPGLDITLPLPLPSRATERVKAPAFPTVSVVLPLFPKASVAVIMVFPTATAVANPAASIVATLVFELVQSMPVRFTFTGVEALTVVPFPRPPN